MLSKGGEMEIKDKVTEFICEQWEIDEKEVIPEALLVNDLGADSLDLVELIMAMEEELGISLPDEELNKVVTVQDFIDCIEKNKSC